MNSTLITGLSGLHAASLRMDAASHNIANAQTAGFRREQVLQEAQPQGGVNATLSQSVTPGPDFEGDVVEQLSAGYAYIANLHMVQTDAQRSGTLLDTLA